MTAQAALCLDLSRLVSRAGRGAWTGVDRVEAAWLAALLGQGERPAFGLVRQRLSYALLDRGGLQGLAAQLRQGDGDLRGLALATCPRPMLGWMLRRLPRPLVYLNTGHSNLTDRVLGTFARRPETRVAVLIHDLIPLTHPEYQRPGMPEAFAARMARVAAHADLAIYNSAATRAEAEAHFATLGRVPEGIVAHLGLPPLPEGPPDLPEGLPPAPPYFVTLGTIEPRKNHALLLDIWAHGVPATLVIAGRRGWANAATFARLDAAPEGIVERAGLSDAAVTALLRGAAGLLFPSHAEGYGLPALEAARLGCPVVCSDLPVFREVLGQYPVYAPPTDPYAWRKAVGDLIEQHRTGGPRPAPIRPPTWEAHVNLVLSKL